jgi:hypothetical protein
MQIEYNTGGTTNLYVDGTLVYSATGQTLPSNAQIVQGGNPFGSTPSGYISYGDNYRAATGYITQNPTDPGPTPTPTPGPLWLHTSGQNIYDSNGKKVILYTIFMQYAQGSGVTLSDIQKMKASGFNTIKLNVHWGLIQPYNETLKGIDQSYFTTAKSPLRNGMDTVVGWAVQENMYVILNLCWTEYFLPPAWAFPGMTDSEQMFTGLISGSSAKARTGMVNTWQYIANRYRDVPNVIFEIPLNEPWVSNKLLGGNDYKVFNEQIISAIESVEAKSHLKIIQLLNDAGWTEILDDAGDVNKQNVLWSSHCYYPMSNWDLNGRYWIDQSFTWNGKIIPQGWGNATTYVAWRLIRLADKIHGWNKPWINTEFSKIVTQTAWDVWFRAVLQTEADYNITGWALFCYSSNPNVETGRNIGNPTTGQQIMTVVAPYMVQPR